MLIFRDECVQSMCEAFGIHNAREATQFLEHRLDQAMGRLSTQMRLFLSSYLPIDISDMS
jgi:hypothetical protein